MRVTIQKQKRKAAFISTLSDDGIVQAKPQTKCADRFVCQLRNAINKYPHIMNWGPCGTWFRVHDRDGFEKIVLRDPEIGFGAKNYNYWSRLLRAHNFWVAKGPEWGQWQHKNLYFQQHNTELEALIAASYKRNFNRAHKKARSQNKKVIRQQNGTNFSEYSQHELATSQMSIVYHTPAQKDEKLTKPEKLARVLSNARYYYPHQELMRGSSLHQYQHRDSDFYGVLHRGTRIETNPIALADDNLMASSGFDSGATAGSSSSSNSVLLTAIGNTSLEGPLSIDEIGIIEDICSSD